LAPYICTARSNAGRTRRREERLDRLGHRRTLGDARVAGEREQLVDQAPEALDDRPHLLPGHQSNMRVGPRGPQRPQRRDRAEDVAQADAQPDERDRLLVRTRLG
jgi:hypothetical protein